MDNGNPINNQPAALTNSAQSPLKKTQWLHSLLQKETTYAPVMLTVSSTTPIPPQVVMSYSPIQFETHSQHTDIFNEITHSQPEVRPMVLETTTHFTPTTVPPPPSMTTDALFAHYKQPNGPLKGPMYLIIQGHSKVKNYGSRAENVTEKHGPKMVPVATAKDPVVAHVVSEDDKGNSIEVMHLHKKEPSANATDKVFKQGKAKNKNKAVDKKSGSTMDNLLSLLDTSFGGLFLKDNQDASKTKPTKKSAGEKAAAGDEIRLPKANATATVVKS